MIASTCTMMRSPGVGHRRLPSYSKQPPKQPGQIPLYFDQDALRLSDAPCSMLHLVGSSARKGTDQRAYLRTILSCLVYGYIRMLFAAVDL